MNRTNNEHNTYLIIDKKIHTENICTLFLKLKNKKIPDFLAGQYINAYFPKLNLNEGKSYSISSAPSENSLSITVKAIGNFSNKLFSLEKGDQLIASLPYGYFYPEHSDRHLILVASGIGIAPFRSIIKDSIYKNPSRKVTLFHSVKNSKDAVFCEEFGKLESEFKNFSVNYFVTQEENPKINQAVKRRINFEDITPYIIDMDKTEILICGSIQFTRDVWKGLKNTGLSEDIIYTEAFF